MVTKLTAARIATAAGCCLVICTSLHPEGIVEILNGARQGTKFHPLPNALKGRKRWLLAGRCTDVDKVRASDGCDSSTRHRLIANECTPCAYCGSVAASVNVYCSKSTTHYRVKNQGMIKPLIPFEAFDSAFS